MLVRISQSQLGNHFRDVISKKYLPSVVEQILYVWHFSGDKHVLRRMEVPKQLLLKVGCPVILLRNISKRLYNGSEGTVVKLDESGPVVRFGDCVMKMEKLRFSKLHPLTNKIIASREQFPLALSFALTVHKAQGQEYECLVVDCHSMFVPGQMAVAVGRAKTLQGLQVINYNPDAARLAHPSHVDEFYYSQSTEPSDSLECCKSLPETNDNSMTAAFEETSFDPQHEQATDKLEGPCNLSYQGIQAEFPATENFDHIKFLNGLFLQGNTNSDKVKIIEDLKANPDTQKFMEHILKTIQDFHSDETLSFAASLAKFHQFITGIEFVDMCNGLVKHTMTPTENKVLAKVALHLYHLDRNEEADSICREQSSLSTSQEMAIDATSAAMKSKLRYIGGHCIFKAKQKIQIKLQSTLQNVGRRSQRQSLILQNKIISKLRTSEASLIAMETNPDDSLAEVKFKQNKNHGLTNISDNTFNFFTNLYLSAALHLDERSFHLNGSETFSKTMQAVFGNLDICQEWLNLFDLQPPNEEEMDEEANDIVYMALLDVADIVISHFVKVLFSEKLKQFKTKNSHQKKQALRPSLMPERKRRCLNPKK